MTPMERIPRKTFLRRTLVGLLVIALALAACNQEGLGRFAPNNSRASIVTNSGKLYTSDVNGGDVQFITGDIFIGFGSSLSPFGDTLVFMRNSDKNIVSVNSRGGSATALVAGSANRGLVTFIPSGEVLYYIFDGTWYSITTMNPNNGVMSLFIPGLDQVFLTQSSFKPKLDGNGTEFITRPYGSGNFALVTTSGPTAAVYIATGTGLSGPTNLARTVNVALQNVFAGRNAVDITSGVVSNDGHKLILRTEMGDPKMYSLYAIDFDTNADPVQLVTNWDRRPVTSFAPESHEVVFDCPEGGGAVCLYDFDTGQRSTLLGNASAPLWIPAP